LSNTYQEEIFRVKRTQRERERVRGEEAWNMELEDNPGSSKVMAMGETSFPDCLHVKNGQQ
jgi:hypothetical protein